MSASELINILLLNDTSKEKHWGCIAAGEQVIKWINECDNITLKTFDVNFSWKYSPSPKNKNELKNIIKSENFLNSEIAKAIQTSDKVIINGEGTLLGNRPPVANLLLFNLYAQSLGKSCAVINSTIYSNNDDAIEKMMSLILPFNDLYTVREIESYSFLRKIGCDNIISCADASFQYFIDMIIQNKLVFKKDNPDNIVLFGSVSLKKGNSKLFQYFVQKLSNQANKKLFLISMSNFEHSLFEQVSDNKKTIHLDRSNSLIKLLEIVGNAHHVYTGRYHGAIMAFSCKTPFIHFNTHSPRIFWLCKQAGISNNYINILDGMKFQKECDKIGYLNKGIDNMRSILTEELKYQISLSNRQNIWIKDFISSDSNSPLQLNEIQSNIEKRYKLVSFNYRAKNASSMLPPYLDIVDFGGGVQTFTKYYKFKRYISFDLLLQNNINIGKPPNSKLYEEFDLPYPEFHFEVDIEDDETMKLCENFDVALLLGIIMWLKDWRSFLLKLLKNNFHYILISWDYIGIIRINELLNRYGFILTAIRQNNYNSFNALFKK